MSLLTAIVFLIGAYLCFGQSYEGDRCTIRQTNANGVCKFLSNCEEAQANLRKGIYPTQCGFSGREIIVCCSQLQSTTARPVVTPVRPAVTSRTPGETADKKCKEYSKYVWTVELSPLLLVGAEDIRKRDCPFNREQLIVGGEPASRREFPHMVQIGFDGIPIKWGCGGTLISEQFVLTAGHCLEDRFLGEALYAKMGFVDIDDPDHVQQYNITQRIAHPEYQDTSNYHDIGLAKLHKKVQLNTWVRPACLYTSRRSPWTRVIATGWGKQDFGGYESQVLLKVVLELYDQPKCNSVYKRESGTLSLQNGIKDDIMICAGHSEDLKDTCQGDSGGPLQVYKSGGQNMSCMYDLIGVTSFGKGCGLAVDIPGVYTRVSYYIKWIEDIVWPTG